MPLLCKTKAYWREEDLALRAWWEATELGRLVGFKV